MLSNSEVIKQSLALHLFFARIMKEHAFFLAIGFSIKDNGLIRQAKEFQKKFDQILIEIVSLSSGVVYSKVLESGEAITPFTLKAEMSSAYFTGVGINTNITEAEIGLRGSDDEVSNIILEQKIKELNNNTISLLMNFINFKDKVLLDMISSNIFTRNYPILLEHMIEEAKFYLDMVGNLQKSEDIVLDQQGYALKSFWNQVMEKHMIIIGVLLDPSEEQLIEDSKSLGGRSCETPIATREIRDFKTKITQGILECGIRSVMIPLLADHMLREVNHYLRILEDFR